LKTSLPLCSACYSAEAVYLASFVNLTYKYAIRWLAGVQHHADGALNMAVSRSRNVSAADDVETPRCSMPNLTQTVNEMWPHQIVNTSCPRFAMMQLTAKAGLAHRFSEVSIRFDLLSLY
jgi:hypothetical protein